ncbi:MAG TPA: hypothetical protein VGF12_05660 [Roseateles sp.]
MLAGLLSAGMAAAEPVKLRLCTSDVPFYPYSMPDGSGLFQRRLMALAKSLNVEVVAHVAPRARCLQHSRNGEADALIGIFSADRLDWMAYPMRGGAPDAERGLGAVRFVLYRRVGTAYGWDGRKFLGLGTEKLGLQFAYAYGPQLAAQGVAVDDRATSAEQLMAKLERGRVALVLMQEEQAKVLIEHRLAGRIEPLEPPFGTQTFYLIVSRDFQKRHAALVQKLWATHPPWVASREVH